jgi:two-component system phosphate regulon sensor histidine kinase PhoR
MAEVPDDPIDMLLDAEKIKRVIINLVTNAIKFTPGHGCITITASKHLSSAEVRVIDTGIGIPAPEREKIFDWFYQVDSSLTRNVGGTGIGLYIAKKYIEMHEGSILVEASEEEKGTTFLFVLPASISDSSEAAVGELSTHS